MLARHAHSRSSPAACWRRRSRWCSRRASWVAPSRASRSSASSRWDTGTRGRCWSPSCRPRWMSGVLDRIVDETGGNPLALLELPRGLTPTQLAGGFGLPANVPLSASIEESFARRLAALPYEARRFLLVAAADPVGDPALVRRTAERLGIPEGTAAAVESEGLLAFGPTIVFRHPLVRS